VSDPRPHPEEGRGGERGTVLLLVIAYALIGLALVLVVIDASAAFLTRRGLSGVADGAATSAAQAADLDRVYADGTGAALPLDPDGVRHAVARYVADPDVLAVYPSLEVLDASTDGQTVTVTVTLRTRKRLPFLSLVSGVTGRFPGGAVPVAVTARARSTVR
jgi:Flp pilus assembly protein TadG